MDIDSRHSKQQQIADFIKNHLATESKPVSLPVTQSSCAIKTCIFKLAYFCYQPVRHFWLVKAIKNTPLVTYFRRP